MIRYFSGLFCTQFWTAFICMSLRNITIITVECISQWGGNNFVKIHKDYKITLQLNFYQSLIIAHVSTKQGTQGAEYTQTFIKIRIQRLCCHITSKR